MRGKEKKEIFKTPLGWAGLTVSDQGICRIVLPRKQKQDVQRELESSERARPGSDRKRTQAGGVPACAMHADRRLSELPSGVNITLKKTGANLRKYFSGNRVLFDLPLDMRYYTRFQKAVWRAAVGIPYGETRSYAWVAKKIGNPRAVRAVGQALGANPVPIIIPCHRVIGSSGKLCGFAGGLTMKRKLLELEAGKVARRA